jgi:hypothetical protein
MATITIQFDNAGNPTPATINPKIGDTVVFQASAQPIVLCVDPTSIFGVERYPIPAGTSISLTVQAGASGNFTFTSLAGDINAECGARGTTGGDGSGKVGGQ